MTWSNSRPLALVGSRTATGASSASADGRDRADVGERRDDRRVQRGRGDDGDRAGARQRGAGLRGPSVATRSSCADGDEVGVLAGAAHRPGRLDRRRGDREQPRRDVHHLGRRAVVDAQRDEAGRVVRGEVRRARRPTTRPRPACSPGPGSPTSVIEPDGQRRASIRHCIAVRSWASSTSTWPNVRGSYDGVVAVAVARRLSPKRFGERRRVGEAAQAEVVDDALGGVVGVAAARCGAGRPAAPLRPDRAASRLRRRARGRPRSTARLRDVGVARGGAAAPARRRSATIPTPSAPARGTRRGRSRAPRRRAPATCVRAPPSPRAGCGTATRSSCSQPSGVGSPRRACSRSLASSAASRSKRLVTLSAGRVDAPLAVRADRRVLVARDEQVVEAARDVLAVLVVRVAPAARALDDARGVGTRQPHAQPVDQHDEVARERTLAVGDRVLDDARHARVALQLRDAHAASVATTRIRGFSPEIVESCTSCSPSEGSTCSM